MVVHHQVDVVQQAAEVVRLHVYRDYPVIPAERFGRERLHFDIEQLGHPQVLGAGDTMERAENRGGFLPVEQGAHGKPARQGVRVGIVVQEDEDAAGIVEVALVLLHKRPEGGLDLLRKRHLGPLHDDRSL